MKHLITIVLVCLSPVVLMAQQDCAHPQEVSISETPYSVSFEEGSEVPPFNCATETNGPNLSMGAWFSFTPDEDIIVTVSTVGSGIDTRVHIYSGTCDNLTCVGGDDDAGGAPDYSSIATFPTEGGVTYLIAFDNNWDSDDFTFTLKEAEPAMFTMQAIEIEGSKNCVVDLNGDYLDDIVSVGSDTTVNVLYQAANDSGFETATLTTPSTLYEAYWSITAGDYDKNGYNDLMYGDGSGFTIMMANDDGTAFDQQLASPNATYIFSQRGNFIDINNDGNLDAFMCHDVQPNVFYINDGAGGGEFFQGGLGDYIEGGNYGSIWTDYDNDGDMDLFIAKCRGGGDPAAIDELHRNNGDGTFTNVIQEDMANHHQSWSSAWGDYDNDGDMDVMIGASSDEEGSHRLYQNDGTGLFTNVTEGSGFDDEALPETIVHVAHDFDNDGDLDVFNGSGVMMLNNGDMTFTAHDVDPGEGAIGDLNNDGFLDIFTGRSEFQPTRVYWNNDNGNNWIKLNLKGIASNRNGIGARVEAYTTVEGEIVKQIREVRSGDGFWYMNTLNVHFGFGETEAIDKIVVKWPSGTVDTILNPDINSSLLVVEGENVLGNTGFTNELFSLYPNPAKEMMTINGSELGAISEANIYDLSGRLVASPEVVDNIVNIQSLAKGTYVIIIKAADGKQHSAKFIKG